MECNTRHINHMRCILSFRMESVPAE